MNTRVSKSCRGFNKVLKAIENDPAFAKVGAGLSVEIGPEAEANFAVPAHAQDACFVGDSAHLLDPITTAEMSALFKKDPSKVNVTPVYDSLQKGWHYKFTKDSLLDGQQFLPWNVSYFKKIFKEPLAYTHAFDLVKRDSGDNPWAEIMSLIMEQYAGWGVIGSTGDLQNKMTNDVNVINGMMSASVINMMVTYTITQAEKERASGKGANPFGESSIATKQRYANYVMNMLKAYMIYYGNEDTETKGLLNVNPVEVWQKDSLADINADATNVTKGNTAFANLAEIVNNFLDASDNKFDTIKIAMAPAAYNLLTSMPYSNTYNPTAAMKIFAENYLSGRGPNGSDPKIQFVSDPMLKADSVFNPTDADYMVLTAPTVGAGPDDQKQDLVLFGMPLDEYVFPAVPGMYNTQFKTMSRVAGIFAPVPNAVKVYQGFGVK
jgi:hypothetical protein